MSSLTGSETGFRRSRWQVSRQLEGFQTPAGPEPGALESTRARRFDRRIQRDQRLSESFMQMRAIPSGTRFRVSSVRFYYARMSTSAVLYLILFDTHYLLVSRVDVGLRPRHSPEQLRCEGGGVPQPTES